MTLEGEAILAKFINFMTDWLADWSTDFILQRSDSKSQKYFCNFYTGILFIYTIVGNCAAATTFLWLLWQLDPRCTEEAMHLGLGYALIYFYFILFHFLPNSIINKGTTGNMSLPNLKSKPNLNPIFNSLPLYRIMK